MDLNPMKWWQRRQKEKRKREITKFAAGLGLAFAQIGESDPAVIAGLGEMAKTGFMPPELLEREPVHPAE